MQKGSADVIWWHTMQRCR